jgi:hypothetical protein
LTRGLGVKSSFLLWVGDVLVLMLMLMLVLVLECRCAGWLNGLAGRACWRAGVAGGLGGLAD